MPAVSNPLLYQLNARVKQHALSHGLAKPLSLDNWPDREWDQLAEQGFHWLWLLGVWQTGAVGQQISRTHPAWQEGFKACLPDLSESDICGSCFAITHYRVAAKLGGDSALQRVRQKLNERGLRLMLDFVPNHTALDHHWVHTHPDFFIHGTQENLEQEPQNFVVLESNSLDLNTQIFAHGRDPYFDGWPDTLQLDYSNLDLQIAMQGELIKIAELCDGVRCDMAMLVLPEVFERTWGRSIPHFWSTAITKVREHFPDFIFLAEVYWDQEWALQQEGFDFTYDKRLYDRLLDQTARPIRDHLLASPDYQRKLVRFLENHDEPRAATRFPPAVHEAAAMINYLAPGMRFFHEGQLEGKQVYIPIHLCRGPNEQTETRLGEFYLRLLQLLCNSLVQDDTWILLECTQAWDGNGTWRDFIIYHWTRNNGDDLLIIVNYAPHSSQCQITLPATQLDEKNRRWRDLMNPEKPHLLQKELTLELFLDFPAWGYGAFERLTD